MNHSRAQIVATIGPASITPSTLRQLVKSGLDVARLNFSHGTLEDHGHAIANIRGVAAEQGICVPIIGDLSGPRTEKGGVHGYDESAIAPLTDKDRESIVFCAEQEIEYVALSYVGNAADLDEVRALLQEERSTARVIAKIERKEALRNLDAIVSSADAIMIARGDLGNEIPPEQIPYIQHEIIKLAKWSHKPVITATEMLLSMVDKKRPTRAEVSDVAYAIISGSDAVMLSEETAIGNFPAEAVAAMERIIIEAELHIGLADNHPL